jgi:hypothetical protein
MNYRESVLKEIENLLWTRSNLIRSVLKTDELTKETKLNFNLTGVMQSNETLYERKNEGGNK